MLAKLYQNLTAGSDVDSGLPNDRFIAWCMGIPYEPEDFLFAIRGFGGGEASALSEEGIDVRRTDDPDAEPGVISGGEDVRRRLLAAASWSRIANFVPDTSGIYDEEQQKKMFDTTAFSQDGRSIVSIYENVLRFSETAAAELTEEQEAKLKRFRGLMTETRTEEDLFTGEVREVEVDSPLMRAYMTYQQEYIEAEMLYNSKRLDALNASDSRAVQDWALNADLYRQRVRAALGRWVSAGYKNQVEGIHAYINQVSQRNLQLLKEDLQDQLRRSKLSDPNTGDFYPTWVIPPRFAFSSGWTRYKFDQTETNSYSKRSFNHTKGNVTLPIPISSWLVGRGGGGRSVREYESEFDTRGFKLEFEFAQALISRPWMSMDFLLSNAWRFGPNMPNLTNMTQTLSDGEAPPDGPNGSMTAIPTAAIFVRDVTVRFNEMERDFSRFEKDVQAQGGLSLGPIRLIGGSHTDTEVERKHRYNRTTEELEVEGMQLIGFKCRTLPKLPNPSDSVETWA